MTLINKWGVQQSREGETHMRPQRISLFGEETVCHIALQMVFPDLANATATMDASVDTYP